MSAVPIDEKGSKIAFVFPGQGAQHVGMGKDLYESSPAARRVLDQANEILDFNLRDLCFNGPEDLLTDTFNAQPAIVATSVACLEALRERCLAQGVELAPSYVAGHSLGEYSALVAAGAVDFPNALLLVRERGRLMREAGERSPGGMAAVLGLDDATLSEVCAKAADNGVVCIANFNSPGQTVISGDNSALAEAMQLAQTAGAKRAIRLAVSIAAHSPLMSEAATHFATAINQCSIENARVPLVANVSADVVLSAEDIRSELREQLCSGVRWHQSVAAMYGSNVGVFLEIGPGQVLSGLSKRIVKDAVAHSINDRKSLEAVWSVLEVGGVAKY